MDILTDFFTSNAINFFRILPIVYISPVLGESYVSNRTKVIIAIFFSLAAPTPATSLNSHLLNQNFATILSEFLIGIYWGLLLRVIFLSLQIAGSMVANATSLAQVFGGTVQVDAQPAIGHLLSISGLALICTLGLHELYFNYIMLSYALLEQGLPFLPEDAISYFVSTVGRSFSLAFQISSSVLILVMLYNIILGVVSRAMPQLMVTFVGAPAIMAILLLALSMYAPHMLDIWGEVFISYIQGIFPRP